MRYLLFAGPKYYPDGGFRDLVFRGNTSDECIAFFEKYADDDDSREGVESIPKNSSDWTWCHIVDSQTFEVVMWGETTRSNDLHRNNELLSTLWTQTFEGRGKYR